ncbi:GNAT family N-acetyltransferase [Pseudomonas sp. RP23018S]|uniref:GNAT family N-acetyltransferase n=1 Tax=Pseudomonas sp. RP23018S TaxID=3096037 RepID=UPI002AC9F41E|nr:GNAT family N-acetyltransferase [Pseudomonas sp. RP23018S]MDZ5605372.1 GNAT family N-acetyltransferase [Pseudomonas sp. RP23018S]
MPSWTLQHATAEHVDEIVRFVNQARAALFPKLADTPEPDDLRDFEHTYLTGRGCFLTARDHGQLVAVIGYVPYDHRFAQFDYRALRVVEVVRLFVLPEYRREGLAAALFGALRDEAVKAGVECLYLHTHPFLAGAIAFWERQGFSLKQVEDDPVWQTTHMALSLVD